MSNITRERKPMWRKVVKVFVTLILWFALAAVGTTVVTAAPNVQPCLSAGVRTCAGAVWSGLAAQSGAIAWKKSEWIDWLILAIALIVAVRIMYPPDDLSAPPK